MKLWTLIPAITILTSLYLVLGINGYWRYTINDFIIGNTLVSLGVGLIYLGEDVYKKSNKDG